MANEGLTRQMVIGMGTSMTSALITASIVFFLLVMRKRLRDKQKAMMRHIPRMPFQRQRSHSAQSALSASGYSAGFRGRASGGSIHTIDDVQDGRQIRKVTAYNDRSFSHPYQDGPSPSAILDPWDSALPSRQRPLVHIHDPFHGRSRGLDRTAHQDSVSSAPPSEGHPAVSAFRPSKLTSKRTPTTFYTYDGRIASTMNVDDRPDSPRNYGPSHESSRNHNQGQGHSVSQGQFKGRDGRNYYYGRQLSNQSADTALRNLEAAGSPGSNDIYATPNKKYKRNRAHDDSPWHSTPIRQSAREPRQRKPSLPRTNSTLRRSSLDNSPSPKESLSWAGVEPHWRSDYSEISSFKQRSGSYDELEARQRRRYDSNGDGDDVAVFNWLPGQGPVISLDHHPSSTYDGDVHLGTKTDSDDGLSRISNDHDSALYSMEDLPKFTRSTAKLDLSNDGAGEDNEAMQLEEMYY